jgi:putative photosynthetic complex assembly protein
LRGLARERRRSGIGSDIPFELVAHTDGRLTLKDPATARRVDLESFGPTNLMEFARLLRDPG